MLKNILKLEGAQKLSKNEQKSINGAYVQKDVYCACNQMDFGWVASAADCMQKCKDYYNY